MSPLALILEMSGGIVLGAIFILTLFTCTLSLVNGMASSLKEKNYCSQISSMLFRKGLMGFALQIECADCNTEEVKKC